MSGQALTKGSCQDTGFQPYRKEFAPQRLKAISFCMYGTPGRRALTRSSPKHRDPSLPDPPERRCDQDPATLSFAGASTTSATPTITNMSAPPSRCPRSLTSCNACTAIVAA